MSDHIEGGCLCGTVRFTVTGEPLNIAWCHCASCRRHSGAPVSVFLAVRRGDFAVNKGEITKFNSSRGRWRGFCARCGSTLTCEGEANSPEGHLHVALVRLDGVTVQRTARASVPVLEVEGQPSAWAGAGRFLRLGAEHIFQGTDHIAFLIGVLLLGGTFRQLVGIVTAFTVAHSITLALAAREPVHASFVLELTHHETANDSLLTAEILAQAVHALGAKAHGYRGVRDR